MTKMLSQHDAVFLLSSCWEKSKQQAFENDEYPSIWERQIQSKLQHIENQLAAAMGRPPASVKFTYYPHTRETSIEEGYQLGCSYARDINAIEIVADMETSGLELLYSLYHEDEHANQAFGCGYTQEQKKMCDIHHVLYSCNPVEYANNYLELNARQKELLVMRQLYNEIIAHPLCTAVDKCAAKEAINILSLRLNHTVSLQNQQKLHDKYLKELRKLSFPAQRLKQYFHATSAFGSQLKAINFINESAAALYTTLCTQCTNTEHDIRDWCDDLEKQEQQQQRDAFLQNQKQRIMEYAQTHNIPVISGASIDNFPTYCVPIIAKEEFEVFIQEAMSQHNVAIWINPYYDICVIADREPIARPWGTTQDVVPECVYEPENPQYVVIEEFEEDLDEP